VSLEPGRDIAHYHVPSKLGEGGMGEVWRATDRKLGRDVALKLLPPALSADPERLARFRREAQVLASLNHPNSGETLGTRLTVPRQLEHYNDVGPDGERFVVIRGVRMGESAVVLAQGLLESSSSSSSSEE
jgi:serine/threonine protein kinase